jgi:hypothetical protein
LAFFPVRAGKSPNPPPVRPKGQKENIFHRDGEAAAMKNNLLFFLGLQKQPGAHAEGPRAKSQS